MKLPGRATTQLVLIDLCPTLLADLCGLTAPADLEGRSLRPLLDDPTVPGKPATPTQVWRGIKPKGFQGYSVRTERYRDTEWDGGQQGIQLDDHKTDPHEQRNLADDSGSASTLAEIRRHLAGLPGQGQPQGK